MSRSRKIPVSAIIGVFLMGGVATWGMSEYNQRSASNFGGRTPTPPPEFAEKHYAELCAIARRCDAVFSRLRWFYFDSTALRPEICQKDHEIWGCYELDTRAITVIKSAFSDTTIIRHELMHAALGSQYIGKHPCRLFSVFHNTRYSFQSCD